MTRGDSKGGGERFGPGGRAMDRLRLFRERRGLPIDEDVPPEPPDDATDESESDDAGQAGK